MDTMGQRRRAATATLQSTMDHPSRQWILTTCCWTATPSRSIWTKCASAADQMVSTRCCSTITLCYRCHQQSIDSSTSACLTLATTGWRMCLTSLHGYRSLRWSPRTIWLMMTGSLRNSVVPLTSRCSTLAVTGCRTSPNSCCRSPLLSICTWAATIWSKYPKISTSSSGIYILMYYNLRVKSIYIIHIIPNYYYYWSFLLNDVFVCILVTCWSWYSRFLIKPNYVSKIAQDMRLQYDSWC